MLYLILMKLLLDGGYILLRGMIWLCWGADYAFGIGGIDEVRCCHGVVVDVEEDPNGALATVLAVLLGWARKFLQHTPKGGGH
jgi:hypothetical protein